MMNREVSVNGVKGVMMKGDMNDGEQQDRFLMINECFFNALIR